MKKLTLIIFVFVFSLIGGLIPFTSSNASEGISKVPTCTKKISAAACENTPVTVNQTQTAAEIAYIKYMLGKNVNGSKIVDVDNNGTPELLMKCEYPSQWCYTLCTYDKKAKKVIVLKKVGMGKDYPECFQYNLSKKQVYFNQGTTGGAKEIFVKVKGKKAVTVKTIRSTRQYPSFNYIYRVNGKKVSYKTWNKKRRSALKGFTSYVNYRY